MKKKLAFCSLCLIATTLATYPSMIHAATNDSTTVTSQITSGELKITSSDTLAFDALAYTGSPITATSNGNATVTVSDTRGTFEGWGVTVQQSQESDQIWGSGMALKLVNTEDATNTVSISTTSTNAFSQDASNTNYDVEQSVTYSGSLVIPASVQIGTYATTLIWTLGATPSA